MTDNVEHIIIEHLKAIRSELGEIRTELKNLTVRVSSLEGHVAGLRRDLSLIHEHIAILHVRGDGFNDRLARIEKRLELTTAH